MGCVLRKRARAAVRMPRAGRRVPELGRDDVREIVVRRYRIVYQLAQRASSCSSSSRATGSFPLRLASSTGKTGRHVRKQCRWTRA